jgi:hypothetical protein
MVAMTSRGSVKPGIIEQNDLVPIIQVRMTTEARKRRVSISEINRMVWDGEFSPSWSEHERRVLHEQMQEWLIARHRDGGTGAAAALINLTNNGRCELYVPSLRGRDWKLLRLTIRSPLERALQDAFRCQVRRLCDAEPLVLPTRVFWRLNGSRVPRERLVDLTWAWRQFDRILDALETEPNAPHVKRCLCGCGLYFLDSTTRKRPREYIIDEHRASANRDNAAYMRANRALHRTRSRVDKVVAAPATNL